MTDGDSDSLRLRRERDLYRRLLDLGRQDALDPFVREALTLIVEATDAAEGYLELHDDEGNPAWWLAHGFTEDQVADVKRNISSGIIAEAVATGKTIVTPSAMLDPRFDARKSVRLKNIEAVLCAPIGAKPPRGVLYLQGQARPDHFSDDDRAIAEAFATELAPLVDQVLARHHEQRSEDPTAALREKMRLDGVIGASEALAATLKQVSLVAPLDIDVLLTGESGTGKSQLARVIHDNGPRHAGPFVELSCANLPEGLLESELFGALPGAHSTATTRTNGKVTAAKGGTLFLDEVGELPLGAQAKLLQLLQSKIYYPLGGTEPIEADVRLIAATNVDLQAAVQDHTFREDLYYRLHVMPIRVPTLAERRTDVPLLARFFCERSCEQHGFPSRALSRNALASLASAEWRGNVRELANVVARSAIVANGEGAEQIETAHLFDTAPNATGDGEAITFQAATRRFQAQFLRESLEEHGWNVQETARQLDLARSHVYNLIGAYGLERKRT